MPLSSSSLAAFPLAHRSSVEWRSCQVSCSSPCFSVSWFAVPSEVVHQLLGAGGPWVETFCSSGS